MQNFKPIALFILVGLIFAAFPGEISNQLLVRRTTHGFVVTMLNYIWFLALGFQIRRSLLSRSKSPAIALRRYYLFYGLLGLMIEWTLLVPEFAFMIHPVQLAMFSFWAGMMTTPWIFVDGRNDESLQRIKLGVIRYMIVWAIISLLPFVISFLFLPRLDLQTRKYSLLMFALGVFGINVYLYRYYRLLVVSGLLLSGELADQTNPTDH